MSKQITIQAHRVFDRMPGVDTDVLIFDRSSPISQVGAYIGDDDDGPMWVDAHGGPVSDVTYWAEMPRLES